MAGLIKRQQSPLDDLNRRLIPLEIVLELALNRSSGLLALRSDDGASQL